jgi:hypothetical protein
MKSDSAERFERLLAALEQELIAATDEEILAAAGDLGMNPAMKGSAAFFGVTKGLPSPFTPSAPNEFPDGPSVPRRSRKDPPT